MGWRQPGIKKALGPERVCACVPPLRVWVLRLSRKEFQFLSCGIRHTARPSVKGDDTDFDLGLDKGLAFANDRLIEAHARACDFQHGGTDREYLFHLRGLEEADVHPADHPHKRLCGLQYSG